MRCLLWTPFLGGNLHVFVGTQEWAKKFGLEAVLAAKYSEKHRDSSRILQRIRGRILVHVLGRRLLPLMAAFGAAHHAALGAQQRRVYQKAVRTGRTGKYHVKLGTEVTPHRSWERWLM